MKTLSAIESFTGGLFAATIVKKSGASKFFHGAIVAYNAEIKTRLGIDISNGVISYDVAKAMAQKGREYFQTDICIAFTGNAGPKALENKPVGKVFIAINDDVYELNFQGSRIKIQKQAVAFALAKLKERWAYEKR